MEACFRLPLLGRSLFAHGGYFGDLPIKQGWFSMVNLDRPPGEPLPNTLTDHTAKALIDGWFTAKLRPARLWCLPGINLAAHKGIIV
jgi:hypothetical protein